MRVGVVGLGFGVRHVAGFSATEGAEVVAVCSDDPLQLHDIAERFAVPHAFMSYQAMLEQAEMDAVVIATPVAFHRQMVLDALQRGLHVFCEKPLALDAEAARSLHAAARAAGVRHMTNFAFRESHGMHSVHRLLRQGVIGQPRQIHLRHSIATQLDPNVPFGWRHQRRLAGMGVTGDLGIHAIDLVRWWAGEFVRLTAWQQVLIPERRRSDGGVGVVDVEDAVMVLAELDSGVLVMLHLSRCCAGAARIEGEVVGDRGLIRFSKTHAVAIDVDGQLTDARASGDEPRHGRSGYERFTEAVLEQRSVEPSFADGWQAQRVADAMNASAAAAGRWVDLDPVEPEVTH